jgi:hypothetical protein
MTNPDEFRHVKRRFNRLFLILSIGWALYCALGYSLQIQIEGQHKADSDHRNAVKGCVQSPSPLGLKDCFDSAEKTRKSTTGFYSLKNIYSDIWRFWWLLLLALAIPPLAAYGLAALGVWIWHGFGSPASDTMPQKLP